MTSQAQANPLPMAIRRSKNASPAAGKVLVPKRSLSVKSDGFAVLSFPLNAGTYVPYSCTTMKLLRSEIINGGLQVDIDLSQTFFCLWPRYRAAFNFRPRKSPQSVYSFLHNGSITLIRSRRKTAELPNWVAGDPVDLEPNTIGAITESGVESYSAISKESGGDIEVIAPNGDTAIAQPGQMAVSSEQGVYVVPAPRPTIEIESSGNFVRVITHPSNSIIIDGVERSSAYSPKVIEVTALTGETKTYRPRQWPKGVWTFR
jgi:hypothetical protein